MTIPLPHRVLVWALAAAVSALTILLCNAHTDLESVNDKIHSANSPKAPLEAKAARWEYFHRMLQDPATGEIPENIRERELAHAARMPIAGSSGRRVPGELLEWTELGPNDIGGRTRAIAVDVTNSSIVMAGGVSGGVWKSTNRGYSWEMKSRPDQLLSVTWITQDTRPGHTNKWYYTTGEHKGNSASDRSYHAKYHGNGIYRSTDSGESWHRLPAGATDTPDEWDGPFDYASKILVHPETGSIYVATHGYGVGRSTNDGVSFNPVVGGDNYYTWSDVALGPDGNVYIALTRGNAVIPNYAHGIFKSTDDGENWTDLTPDDYQAGERIVLATAPSEPAILYVLQNTGRWYSNSGREIIKLFRINVTSQISANLSDKLPDFGNNYHDFVYTQNSYNMAMAVKPDDKNIVLIGATSVFRSFEEFNAKPNSMKLSLIGGFWPEEPWRYPNLHPDTHIFCFDPANPNALFVGHDGGISYIDDITNQNYPSFLPWQDMNYGYNVTQFYTVAIPDEPGDNRIAGGTQDNGSLYFRVGGYSVNTSGGDGGYCQFTDSFLYSSAQRGLVVRQSYNGTGDVGGWENMNPVYPQEATDQLFVNPYLIDPANENVMYYPSGRKLWRNTALDQIPDGEPINEGTTAGWETVEAGDLNPSFSYTTIGMARNAPGDILYAGVYGTNTRLPHVLRFENASGPNAARNNAATTAFEIGGEKYPHCIAVNPNDPDELMVVFSNYNIDGLFHSNDGGVSYTLVEGNLTGTEELAGPSLRSALIQPQPPGEPTLYFVGTSTGLYSTTELRGSDTVWELEAPNTIGNVVVEYLTGRTTDGKIVAATHGRGVFQTFSSAMGTPEAATSENSITMALDPHGTDSHQFSLYNAGTGYLVYELSARMTWLPEPAAAVLPMLENPVPSRLSAGTGTAPVIARANVSPLRKGTVSPEQVDSSLTLILDDGDDKPDDFLGTESGEDFTWINRFDLTSEFSLNGIQFYMRTSNAGSNQCVISIYDGDLNVLGEDKLSLSLSEEGDWFTLPLSSAWEFAAGESFYISIQTSGSGIQYPAGFDYSASITDQSFTVNAVTGELINLNTIEEYAKGAFLIRAFGEDAAYTAPEFSFTPQTGTISENQSDEITISLEANDAPKGIYNGALVISYNGGVLELPLTVTINPSTSVEDDIAVPVKYALEQNFPNPFNPSTTISFSMKEQGFVEINLFSVSGELVRTIAASNYGPGRHEINFNAGGLSSGVYLYTMQSNDFFATKKMMLMK